MKPFTKPELISLAVIFLVLIGVSWPNFALSLRRARDQVRRDDIGNIQAAIDAYYDDYGMFPPSTPDGKIAACKDMSPCSWGRDAWINLTPGVTKTYMRVLPGDPSLGSGVSYIYFSDGSRYQLFGALEGQDEPSYDAKLVERGVMCGTRVCNMGRVNNVPMYISIEEYDLQIYCGQHPKDIKCIK